MEIITCNSVAYSRRFINGYIKLDTKNAYYSISIRESCQKLLKFQHKKVCYRKLPKLYTGGHGKINKLYKPPLSYFRKYETC